MVLALYFSSFQTFRVKVHWFGIITILSKHYWFLMTARDSKNSERTKVIYEQRPVFWQPECSVVKVSLWLEVSLSSYSTCHCLTKTMFFNTWHNLKLLNHKRPILQEVSWTQSSSRMDWSVEAHKWLPVTSKINMLSPWTEPLVLE